MGQEARESNRVAPVGSSPHGESAGNLNEGNEMTKRPVGRPPRIPRDEPATVTIGNLERQAVVLMSRCDDLVGDRAKLNDQVNELGVQISTIRWENQQAINMLQDCQAKLAATEKRFEGYQAAIMDILGFFK